MNITANMKSGVPGEGLVVSEEMTEKPSAALSACSTAPWMIAPLNEWAIVGMNHYHVDGERRLFVSMAKDGRCIKEEGADDQYLWNRLWHKATGQ